jgi:predicted ATPase
VGWAQELEHAYSLVWALTETQWVRLYRQEWQEAQEQIETALALATDYGFSVWIAFGTVLRGWLLLQQGQVQEGLEEVHRGLSRIRATGTRTFEPLAHAVLIEAYGKTGQVEMGLQAVSEALQFIERYDNRFFEAEMHRLNGELTLQKEFQVSRSKFHVPPSTQHLTPSTQAEAEGHFLQAIAIAQQQQAKSLELRAVMSLVRLRQQQALRQSAKSQAVRGEQKGEATRNTQHVTRTALDEARNMLSSIYNWFTEGFDTKDLQEAKALLKELSD